jgi:hypothetical protein
MGFIVEVKILRDLHAAGLIGDWDAPYPLLDVSGNLQQAGEDPTSVDGYVRKHGLSVGEFEGGTHNPLYDSAAAAVVYRKLISEEDLKVPSEKLNRTVGDLVVYTGDYPTNPSNRDYEKFRLYNSLSYRQRVEKDAEEVYRRVEGLIKKEKANFTRYDRETRRLSWEKEALERELSKLALELEREKTLSLFQRVLRKVGLATEGKKD